MGSLPFERVFLKLKRHGSRVNALCGVDGVEWFTVGNMDFPVENPIFVCLHTIGSIDRTIYHNTFPKRTASSV